MVEQAIKQVIDDLERENQKSRAEINEGVYSGQDESNKKSTNK
ncbi:hypothetical protein [Lactiplantibacillus plantarum]|nr:hypothetical protein [Lactiplantibacillus plantarum]